MNLQCFLTFFIFYFIYGVFADTPGSLEKGWGTEIKWLSLKQAKSESAKSNKPVMVLITKSWCGACKALRPKFADSTVIASLSKYFLMVLLEDEEQPEGKEFLLDGRYIPRVYFLGADGKVMKDVINANGKHVKEFKYYYGKVSQIAESMRIVLTKLNIMFDDVKDSGGLARGFGDNINWMTYKEGLREAEKSKKILLLLIHKSWCGACKALKPKFRDSEKFAELSKSFVMVNVEDKEEPSGNQFVVDGEYVPRIFFMDPEGRVMEKYWNEDTKYPHTKYYYSSASEVIRCMERVLEETKKVLKQDEKKDELQRDKKPWWMPKDGIEGDISNGFGEHIHWHTYKDGLEQAKKSDKPMVLIFSKTTCPSCKALKERFSNDKDLEEWSKKFIMVNIKENEGPEGKEFKPDGDYVPRIVFLDPSGKVMSAFWNEATTYKHVKYYYQDGSELIESMKRVVKKFKKPAKDNGWGKSFDWYNLEDAYERAKELSSPVVLVIHKSWCSACKAVKKKFSASQDLLAMSRNFVMVNVEDDDAKLEKQFDVDGAYVPRIYFIDPHTKKVMKDIYNKDPAYGDYKYAYGEANQLLASMKKAVSIEVSKPIPQGFGSEITWVSLNDALPQAKKSEKPVMLILHRSWCQHSQALGAKIAESKEIAKRSKDFVMVNLKDDEIPKKTYDIDGSYVPRIIFLDHKGDVQKAVTNPNTPVEDAKYFYENTTDIINSMRKMSPVHGLDRGFGKSIAWMTLTEGLKYAKENNKVSIVIIHKTWCGACKVLKPHFANSTEIHEMSKNFAMINLEDDEEPKDDQFDVDGLYFPRVFFLDPNGEIIKSIHNTKLKYLKYKYAYGDAETVLKSMKIALKQFTPNEEKKEEKQELKKQETKQTKAEIKTKKEKTTPQGKKGDLGIDKGLGKDITWVSLDEGYITARKSWKPMLLIIHKSWCTACQSYVPKFAASKEIKRLSLNFVMVNVQDDFDHTDKRFDVDGAYLPRTLFLNPMGEIMKDIFNEDTPYPDNKYYHYDPESVVKAMQKALLEVKKMKKIEKRDEL